MQNTDYIFAFLFTSYNMVGVMVNMDCMALSTFEHHTCIALFTAALQIWKAPYACKLHVLKWYIEM